ncbi:MAG: DNA repair protein RecO [Gammaproteobacteria bacterium]
MGKGGRRVDLAPLYVLHHRPWRDTSRMLDVLTRDHGRLTLFARGVRGPKSRSASLLQPFCLLLASWSGSGDAGQLTQVEAGGDRASPLPAASLLSAWYLNELVLKLTTRHDPQPAVFDLYHDSLNRLRAGEAIAAVLRRFERQLLDLLGYGVEFRSEAREGQVLKDEAYYHFHPELGFTEVTGGSVLGTVFRGRELLGIGEDRYDDPAVLETARSVLRLALDHALEGRDLRTRAVARAVAGRRRNKEA